MGIARKDDRLVICALDGEFLFYDLERDKAFCLNPTSAAVWNLCDGHRTPQEIVPLLESEGVSGGSLAIVELALHQLNREGLLRVAQNSDFAKINRRDLVRRAGMTAAAALPLVTSIVVPMPAAAQSGACGPTAGLSCTCSDKVRNFSSPCPSAGCAGNCNCAPPFTGCNPGGILAGAHARSIG